MMNSKKLFVNVFVNGIKLDYSKYTFARFSQFMEITVDEDNPYFCAEDGVLFNKSKTELICYPEMKEASSYTVPEGVTTIGACAFYSTELIEITLPGSLQTIGSSAFRYARNLSEITLPSNLTTIRYDAFESCDLITSISIPASVTTINSAICNGRGLQWFSVEADNQKFKAIDGVLFDYSGAKLINYPNGKRDTSYSVPHGTTIIGGDAFYRNETLSEITLPEGIVEIQSAAFLWCNNLKSITLLATIPCAMGNSALSGSGTEIQTIYVPNDSVEAYKAAKGWSDYADIIIGIDVNGTVVGPDPEIPD